MFYFVNLGTFLSYAAGATLVGGGRYTAWCFKDTISTSVKSPNILNQHQTWNVLKHQPINTKFREILENNQKNQEKLIEIRNEITKLHENNESSSQEVDDLEQEINNIKNKNTDLNNDIQSSNNKIEELELRKKEKTNLITASTLECSQKHHYTESLKSNIISNKVDIENLQKDLDDKEVKKTDAEKALLEHEEKLKSISIQIDKLEKSVNYLVIQQKNQQEKITIEKDNKITKTNSITSIEAGIKKKINDRITEINTATPTLISEIATLKEKAKTQQEILKTHATNLGNWQDSDGNDKKQKLEQDKRNAQNNLTTANRLVSDKESEKSNKDIEKQRLTQQLNLMYPFTEIYKTVGQLKTDINNASDELQKLHQETTRLEEVLKKMNKEKSGIDEKLSVEQALLTTTKQTKLDLTSSISDLTKQKDEMKKLYDDQVTTVEGARISNNESVKQLNVATQELSKKIEELEKIKTEESQYEVEIQGENTRSQDFAKELAKTMKKLHEKEAKKIYQEKSIVANKENIKSKQLEVQELQKN